MATGLAIGDLHQVETRWERMIEQHCICLCISKTIK